MVTRKAYGTARKAAVARRGTARQPVTRQTVTRQMTTFRYVDVDDNEASAVPKKGGGLTFKKRGWYVPAKNGDGFLAGLKCPICQRAFKKDQSVYAWSIMVPQGRYSSGRRYVALHGACMAAEAAASPIEKWTEIRDKIKNGKGLFD